MKGAVLVLMLTTSLLQHGADAQIPSRCSDAQSLRNQICCPEVNGLVCSGPTRGVCVNVSHAFELETDARDARHNWPHYYSQVCQCTANFQDSACSRCAYGYYGDNCENKQILPRRKIDEFSESDWSNYINILKKAKQYDSGYKVVVNDVQPGGSTDLELRNISLYDLFSWMHHYVAKDNRDDIAVPIDFAHESTGFPTWHRQFLLWFEWEIQGMLKAGGDDNYHQFRLSYWNWLSEDSRMVPFARNRLGETVLTGDGRPEVEGDLTADGWTVICWPDIAVTCDPLRDTYTRLQRCPSFAGSADPCRADNGDWPTQEKFEEALKFADYEDVTHGRCSRDGFRNFLEGFVIDDPDSTEKCNADNLCRNETCQPPSGVGGNVTSTNTRVLHNAVHIILGIGDFRGLSELNPNQRGVMGDVRASANDPIFLNHHAMIDCIFEEWLQKYRSTQNYSGFNDIPVGHRGSDYIVPFLPIFTHTQMFETADNFGYSCSLSTPTTSSPRPDDSARATPLLKHVVVMLAVVVAMAI